MEICSGGELFERIVAESEKHVPLSARPALCDRQRHQICSFADVQDGARAFDERGAATYMQQILGAMWLGSSARQTSCLAYSVG